MISNCISPSKDNLCLSTNAALLTRIESGFSDTCDLPSIGDIIRDETKCTIEDHCQTVVDEESYTHVHIIRTDFFDFYHEDNGGTIYIKNSGMSCQNAFFESCNSTNGGGGGIYIYNDLKITNKIVLAKIDFSSCKAAFGSAIYIYELYKKVSILLDTCSFKRNEVYPKSSTSSFYGRSAIYITATNSKITFCRFLRNKGDGGSIKIDYNFDQKPPINQNAKTLSNSNSAGSILLFNLLC